MPKFLGLPNIDPSAVELPDPSKLRPALSGHRPRSLLLYGSLRECSFSRLLTEEAARLRGSFGAECRIFSPSGLPLPDDAPADHSKVAELRELSTWSEGQVWS